MKIHSDKAFILIMVLAVCSTLFSFGQARNGLNNVHAGPKYAWNSTWLLNQNVMDLGDEQNHLPSFSSSFGVSLGTWIMDNIGFEVEYLTGSFKQKYDGTINDVNYTSEVKLKTTDIPFMLKLRTYYDSRGYFDLGAQYTSISQVDLTIKDTLEAKTQVDKSFEGSNMSLILGLGTMIEFHESLVLTIGMRGSYGLTDLRGVDARGNEVADNSIYSSYKPTHTATLGFHFVLYYLLDFRNYHKANYNVK